MQRKLHPLEGIVAVFALFFVLALTIGFAQAQDAKVQKAVYLRSSSALVLDADTGEIVIDKNADTVTPIASITKLMTAMVVLDRGLDLDQRIVLSRDDIDSLKGTRSRLRPGNVLTRRELLLIALMASENRAAAALRRPGARPHLSGRHRAFRRRDERQGRGARHEGQPLRRFDRPFAVQRFQRARPGEAGACGARI